MLQFETFRVICDCCGRTGVADKSGEKALQRMVAKGWRRTKYLRNGDTRQATIYCPKCAKNPLNM